MKKKSEKQADVEALNKVLASTPNVFVAAFSKLTVAQDFQLRKTVRGAGGMYQVVKNTIAAKAGAGTPAEEVTKSLSGMTSIAYTATDPVGLAKCSPSTPRTTRRSPSRRYRRRPRLQRKISKLWP
jgi:large subunit ribosomal protein L10